jgi:hypothetical protein
LCPAPGWFGAQLPAGFNFSDADLNFSTQDIGDMVAFSDSELDKIPGYVLVSNRWFHHFLLRDHCRVSACYLVDER